MTSVGDIAADLAGTKLDVCSLTSPNAGPSVRRSGVTLLTSQVNNTIKFGGSMASFPDETGDPSDKTSNASKRRTVSVPAGKGPHLIPGVHTDDPIRTQEMQKVNLVTE